MSLPIEDYALIGDCQTAALVGRNGSIDWLCWPRFDSDACFAALLGTEDHGHWRIAPRDAAARVTRQYRQNTLILETRFECSEGAVTLIDFMPTGRDNPSIVRRLEGRSGRLAMHMQLTLRFDYGSSTPWVTQLEEGDGISAILGPNVVVLRTSAALEGRDRSTYATFDVGEGEHVEFTLSWGQSHLPLPEAFDGDAALSHTEAFWRDWSARCEHRGQWRQAVLRSLLTLKALTYAPTGGIVAAATTSLPEKLGGVRNWDYRFCWLRDATITLQSLLYSGFQSEATPPPNSCSSTSMARSSTHCTSRVPGVSSTRTRDGRTRSCSSSTSRASGSSQMTGSGKCGASAATSPTPR